MRDCTRFADRPPDSLAQPESVFAPAGPGGRARTASRGRPSRSRRAAAAEAPAAPPPSDTPARRLVLAGADIAAFDDVGAAKDPAPPAPVAPTPDPVVPAPAPVAPPAAVLPAPAAVVLAPAAPPPPPPTEPTGQEFIDGGSHQVRPLGALLSDQQVAEAVERITTPRRPPRAAAASQVMAGFLDQLTRPGATAPAPAEPAPPAATPPTVALDPEDLNLAAAAGIAALATGGAPPAPAAPAGPSAAGSPAVTGPLFSLTASVGAGGQNRPQDVQALKRRLVGLGFNWLTTADDVDPATVEAIQLFQAIKNGNFSVKGHAHNDGLVEVGKDTYRWLQAVNAPRWQLLPTGSRAEGFENSERADSASQYDYGTDWLATTIAAAGAAYRDQHLAGNAAAAPLTVNDGSLPRGVPQPGEKVQHAGHQTGLECDLRLPRGDGRAGQVTVADTLYDRDAMRAMLRALRAQPLFQRALLNDPVLIAEGLCVHVEDHDDHAHVQLRPPAVGAVELADPPTAQSVAAADGPAPPSGPRPALDHLVPGVASLLAQPSPNTGWAAAATMLVSWRDQTGYSVHQVMDRAGPAYRSRVDSDQGLLGSEAGAFIAALDLREEPPAGYGAEELHQRLRSWGPLWVALAAGPTEAFSAYAQVVIGITGDGMPEGTMVRVNDPATGRHRSERFADFLSGFEAAAGGRPAQLHVVSCRAMVEMVEGVSGA